MAGVDILHELDEGTRKTLEQRCHWQIYSAGEQIIRWQEPSDDIYFLIDGLARVAIYSGSGKLVGFHQIDPGSPFGEFAAIDGQPRSANVEAAEECLVARMSSALFWVTLEKEPAVVAALLKRLVGQIRSLTTRVFEFSTLAVSNRIQAELLRLARESAIADNTALITPAPTHTEIASRISTHREAVTRELGRLTQMDVIRRDGKALCVTDVERLARMVQEASGD
ncbi:MAG: Crp/Fnr family transcriptional regulator [Methyloligellaceae bacterium]